MTFAAVHLLHPSVLWLLPLALLPFLLHRRSEDASRRLVSALHLWPASPPPVQRAPRTNPFVLDRRSLLLAAGSGDTARSRTRGCAARAR
jgi:hypothetical protein